MSVWIISLFYMFQLLITSYIIICGCGSVRICGILTRCRTRVVQWYANGDLGWQEASVPRPQGYVQHPPHEYIFIYTYRVPAPLKHNL
jgi:hypothetical protein